MGGLGFGGLSERLSHRIPLDTRRSFLQRYWMAVVVAVGIFSFFCAFNAVLGVWEVAALHGAVALGILVSYRASRRRHPIVGCHLLLLALLTSYCTVHFFDGGFRSLSLWFLPCLPMCAFYLVGRRSAGLYTAAGIACIGLNLFFADATDQIPVVINHPSIWVTVRIQGLVCFAIFGFVASITTRRRLVAIASKNLEVQKEIQLATQANQTQSKFLSTMSHEIRTPMNGILGMTSVLQGAPSNPAVSKSVASMHTSAQRLLKILNRILDLSKLEAQLDSEEARKGDEQSVEALIRSSVASLPHRLTANKEGTRWSLAPCQATIRTNTALISRILGVLIENALEQDAQRAVEIGFQQEASPAFYVRDYGAGMSLEQSQRLHSHLENIDKELDYDPHGVGLGLTFALQLAQTIHARISFERCKEHTTFWLHLPSHTTNSERIPSKTKQPRAKALEITDRHIRKQRLSVFLRIIGPAVGIFLLHDWVQGLDLALGIAAITSLLLLASGISNRFHPESSLPSWLLLIGLHVFLGGTSFSDGQLYSETMWLLPIIPLLAAFLLGAEASLLCVVSCIAIIGTDAFVFSLLPPVTYEQGPLDYAAFRLAALCSFTWVADAADRVSNRQQLRLERRTKTLKLARRVARIAQQRKSRFLERMSHEIRTPMNGLLVSAEFLLSQSLDPVQSKSVETIHRCGRHLVTLLDEVLDLDADVDGQRAITEIPFGLNQLLKDVTALFEKRAALANLELTTELPEQELIAVGDPTRILQIISNLVGNAIKFSDTGTICLKLEAKEAQNPKFPQRRRVEISVQDQGIGISAERLPELFQDFVQVDATENNNARGGSGLGLAISKRLAKRMGGELRVESVFGEGSTFTLCLDLNLMDAPVSRPTPISSAPSTQENFDLHVLIVDDNAINRRVAEFQLKRLGCSFDCAQDGQEAVDMANQRKYDVIFMDLRMPNLNGIEATQEIRAHAGPNQDCYIVALTADKYEQQRQACLDAGMNEHLSKPYNATQLKAVLEQFGGRSNAA